MIQLTVYVSDIEAVMSVFTHIRLYTSTEEDGMYTHLDYILLVAGQSTYEYTHTMGTSDSWYRSSYWSVATESSLSDPVQGTEAELYHYPTYPSELEFNSSEETIIRKIRRLIGDLKKLERIYTDGTDFCSSVANDNKTIDMGEKGWPVYISINTVEYTALTNPYTQGYQYLTFSGSLISGSQNPTIDLWFYTFKFSDREIYQSYNDAMIPYGLTSTTVTQDHLILQASIDTLTNMWAEDSVDDGANITDDATRYGPGPGLLERDKTIKHLQKILDNLIKQYMFVGTRGILID